MNRDDLIQQIQADQRWLEQLSPDVQMPPGCADRLKQRVQVALDEAWLANRGVEVPAPANLEALKQAVANQLGTQESRQPPQSPERKRRVGRTLQLFAALSAAAVLLLAVGLYDRSGTNPADPIPAQDDFDTFTTVLAADLSDEEVEWRSIEEEIDNLESALASSSLIGWDSTWTDDLGADLDALSDEFQDDHDLFDRGAG